MCGFHEKPRFEATATGEVVVRVGTQAKCGGIAEVTVRISVAPGDGLTFSFATGGPGGSPSPRVPGFLVPGHLRDAFAEGASRACAERGAGGLAIELVRALVHPTDSNSRAFYEAGFRAVAGWLDSRGGDE